MAVSSLSAAVAFTPFWKVRLMILAFLALLGISALCFAVAALVLALGDDLFLAWVAFVAVPLIVAALVDICNRFGRHRAAVSPSASDAAVNAKRDPRQQRGLMALRRAPRLIIAIRSSSSSARTRTSSSTGAIGSRLVGWRASSRASNG